MQTLFSFVPAGFLAAGLMLPTQAQGALLVHDGFGVGVGANDYTAGAAIDGQGHGTGWTGVWETGGDSDNYVTNTGSIVPAGIQSQDGVMVRAGGNSVSLDASRVYSTTFGGATPTIDEAWFSFGFQRNASQRTMVINPFANNASGGAGQFFGVLANAGSDQLVARIRYGTSADIVSSVDSYALTLGTSYFVVGQALFNAAGNADVLNVYVFESASYNGTLPANPTMTVSRDLDSSFTRWTVNTQNPQDLTNVLVYDEFRIGDTFADVTPVPEPASIAALGLAGLGLMARRRRA